MPGMTRNAAMPDWGAVHADVGSALSALHDADYEKVHFYLTRLWLTARPLYVTEDGSSLRARNPPHHTRATNERRKEDG